jgi:hypothetical protein
MGTIAKFLFALQDTHNMGISPSGSAGKEALSRSICETLEKPMTRPGVTGRVRCYLRCAGSVGINLTDRRHRYGTVGPVPDAASRKRTRQF